MIPYQCEILSVWLLLMFFLRRYCSPNLFTLFEVQEYLLFITLSGVSAFAFRCVTLWCISCKVVTRPQLCWDGTRMCPHSPVNGIETQVQTERLTLHPRNAHYNLFSHGSFCTRSGVNLSYLSSARWLAWRERKLQTSACDARRVKPSHA